MQFIIDGVPLDQRLRRMVCEYVEKELVANGLGDIQNDVELVYNSQEEMLRVTMPQGDKLEAISRLSARDIDADKFFADIVEAVDLLLTEAPSRLVH